MLRFGDFHGDDDRQTDRQTDTPITLLLQNVRGIKNVPVSRQEGVIHIVDLYTYFDTIALHSCIDHVCILACFRVWQDWIVENDSFVGFNFVMGEECGAVDREAKVSEMRDAG